MPVCHSARKKSCLPPRLPLPLHHLWPRLQPRRPAPASLVTSTIHACTTASNSQEQQRRTHQVRSVLSNYYHAIWREVRCITKSHISVRPGFEDDKFQLPFTVTDLRGQNLQLVSGPHNGQVCARAAVAAPRRIISYRLSLNLTFPLRQSVCVEQLTLDFEYLINEVIRNDAAWASQFCSFSDYDVVILEVNIR